MFVLAGNYFRTLSIRPLVMYGELDHLFIAAGQTMAGKLGGILPRIRCCGTKQQQAYVGNVAWGFICAEVTLYQESLASHPKVITPSSDDNVEKVCTDIRRRLKSIEKSTVCKSDTIENSEALKLSTDHTYYIVDDTPVCDNFDFQTPYLEASGYRVSKIAIPMSLVIFGFFILYYCLKLLRILFPNVNYPVSVGAVKFLRKSYVFSDAKARKELGYKPLYTPNEAHKRSIGFYQQNQYQSMFKI